MYLTILRQIDSAHQPGTSKVKFFTFIFRYLVSPTASLTLERPFKADIFN